MGFFSDLKEDLSQAVNELMPEEITETAEKAETEAKEVQESEAQEAAVQETEAEKAAVQEAAEQEAEAEEWTAAQDAKSDTDTRSLDEMLANIDAIEIPEELQEDMETVSAEEKKGGAADASAGTDFFDEDDPEEELDDVSDWNLESMLEKALKEETVSVTDDEKTDGEQGEGKAMEMSVNREASDETSIITGGMTISGDVSSEGSLDIVGTVNGNIDIRGKLNITGHIVGNSKAAEIYAEGAKINGEVVSEGSVKIGASSVIVGNITATSAAIAGAVKGDIDVRGPVILDTSAIVMGNIKSKSVQINNGAVIEGMCSQCYADVSPASFFEEYKMETKKDKTK